MTIHSMSEAEIERRAPVWTALSNLFLDTELQENDLRYIADQLHASGYTLSQLQAILTEEVAPVFHANFCSVAGEWQPWDADFVREHVLEYLNRRPSFLERMIPRAWMQARRERHVQEQWQAVQSLLASRP